MDPKTKEERIADIRSRIQRSPIRDQVGRKGVLLSYTLSDGRVVGTRAWGADTNWFVDLAINEVAHSVLYHEEVLKGGAV